MSGLEQMRARLPEMTRQLESLVQRESPTNELDLVAACADEVARIGTDVLGVEPERIEVDGHPHLRWTFGIAREVVLLCHMDTVWPRGTIDEWPFAVDGERATGPGSFDMKSGIVQAFHALAALPSRDGVTLLVTSDEETGSASSRALIEDTARGARACLVLESAAGDALKIERKGVSVYTIEIEGREAHAGLEPERGVNALIEASHQVLALAAIAGDGGSTVTPTVARAGTATNVVPARAVIDVDVRTPTRDEQARVDAAMHALRPVLPGARVTVTGGPNRPPLDGASSSELFARAQRIAKEIGLGELRGVAVGGGSDGNFTAGIGVPTLDGLGAVGDGAHARGEHVVLASMPERAALVAALIEELLYTR